MQKLRAQRILALALVVTAAATALVLPRAGAVAQEKSYLAERWVAHYEVQRNGDVRVAETQSIKFTGSFSFYGRTIPHNRFDRVEDVRVVDDDTGERLIEGLDYELTPTFSEGFPATDILLHFSAFNEIKTWTISYTAVGAVGFFEDHDEFYWNVIPHDREVPIAEIEATVVLPEFESPPEIRTTHYESGVADVRTAATGNTVKFITGLARPYTDFTIVVGWPTGVVDNPGIVRIESTLSGADVIVDGEDLGVTTPYGLRGGREVTTGEPHQVQVRKYGVTSQPTTIIATPGQVTAVKLQIFDTPAKLILAIVVVTLVVSYALLPFWVALVLWLRWRKTGRDPKGQVTIVAQFEPPPPDDAKHPDTPGIVGTLVDERADLKDLTASIVDLAVRGYLVIEELPKKHSWSQQDYNLVRKKEWANDPELKEYEKLLLDEVLGSSKERKLSELKNKFYVRAPRIQEKLYEQVVNQAYFTSNPDKRRKRFYGWGTVLIIVGFWLTTAVVGTGLPILVTGIVVILFGRGAPQRTLRGVLSKEHALGFKEYLYRAERYVVRKMTPETFERFLPYAMVFGVESEWAARFKDIYRDREPSWYHGSTPHSTFNAIVLANAMSSWSTAASTTLSSRPSSSGGAGGFSSGGSGFSGGFSGGGGGGGGMRAG